jgi:hypothetical protein
MQVLILEIPIQAADIHAKLIVQVGVSATANTTFMVVDRHHHHSLFRLQRGAGAQQRFDQAPQQL